MKKIFATFILLTNLSVLFGQSFDASRLGKGLVFVPGDSSFKMQMNIRYQSLYSGVHNYSTGEWNDKFLTRRFRLKFKGYVFSPKLNYKIELALSNRDQKNASPEDGSNIVLDAVLKYNLTNGLQVWFGQTKLPGNRERVISSKDLQFVDRSNLNSKFNIDRGKGIQLRNEHSFGGAVFREAVALTMGDGRNNIDSNSGGYDLTLRGEVLPFGKFAGKGDYFGADLAREAHPKLSIGATYDHNQGASLTGGQIGKPMGINSTLQSYFIDAMFKFNGVSVMAEYANKWVKSGDEPYEVLSPGTTPAEEERRYFYTGQSLNVQAGYLFKNNFEFAGRYTTTQPTRNVTTMTEGSAASGQHVDFTNDRYSVAFSKYISGHTVKIQSTFTYVDFESAANDKDEFQALVQVEIGF